MRVLILSCNTGQGHNSAGLAVKEALERQGAQCDFVDALSFLSQEASELIAGSLVNVAVKAPKVFGHIYEAGEFVSNDRLKSPVYFGNALYAENLSRYMREGGFDAAVCPHLFPAEALTYLKRHGRADIPCYSVATDYTCIPFMEETELDGYFLPHDDAAAEYIHKGVPAEKLIPTGIPVSARFRVQTERGEARRRLGLPEKGVIYLIMTGGAGCGDAAGLAERVVNRTTDGRALVICGRNDELRRRMEERFAGEERVVTLGFTDKVPLYMDACDALITKPGGLSSTEAAVKNAAIVHSPPIPGCETENSRFFAERGLAVMALDEDMAVSYAINIARDPDWAAHMKACQRREINPRAADDIAERVIRGL